MTSIDGWLCFVFVTTCEEVWAFELVYVDMEIGDVVVVLNIGGFCIGVVIICYGFLLGDFYIFI